MPKKTNSRAADGVAREQSREGGYSLGAPQLHTTDDGIVAVVQSTARTVYGESPITTTVTFSADQSRDMPTVKDIVRRAIEDARSDAEAVIEAVEEEWEANVGEFDNADGDDEDEGLREGPVVARAVGAHASEVDAENARDYSAFRHAQLRAFAHSCDLITVPNAEYADLVAAKRRLEALQMEIAEGKLADVWAALRDAVAPQPIGSPVHEDDANNSEVDLEALNAAFAGIPAGPYDVIKHSAGWEVRQLDTDPTDKHHWPVRLFQGISGQKAGFDDAAANFLAGVLNAWPLIAARLAATEGDGVSDKSDAVLDDGGPVEPELDIDALVAGCGVQASIDGRPVPVTVSFTLGDRAATFVSNPRTVEDLRKALADARNAGGLR